MNYCNIRDNDIANGSGVRVSLFVSGCGNRCNGCFQPETWDESYGMPYTAEVEKTLFDMVDKPHIAGLTFLGGDPLYIHNYPVVRDIILRYRKRFKNTKDIWLYTGYYIDRLLSKSAHNKSILLDIVNNVDWIVDGPFVKDLYNIKLQFRGSSNQRIINAKLSLIDCGILFVKNHMDDTIHSVIKGYSMVKK